MARRTRSAAERFWGYVPERSPWPDECWEWRGAINPNGYGKFALHKNVARYAHRMAWILSGSELPRGMEIDHACRNRACVKPEHLVLVERGYNAAQGVARALERRAQSTACRRGHPWTSETTKWRASPPGRICRVCFRESRQGRRARI